MKFYNYLSKNNIITKNNITKIIDFFKTNKNIKFSDGSTTDYTYFKFDTKRTDSSTKNIRFTRVFRKITKIEDKQKYRISIVANYIQSMDACLVRWVLSKIIITTIHDCFMVDYMNISYIIALINEGMNVFFHEIKKNENFGEIFSIFIII